MQCRICLGDDSPETLLQPCRCTGTIAYVHSACLDTYVLYVPDRICRVCRTPFQTPDAGLSHVFFWVLLGSMGAGVFLMQDSGFVRAVYAGVILVLASLYTRLRVPPSGLRVAVVLALWGCLSWIETAAAMVTFLGICGLLLTVYTLCHRVGPMVVLVILMHIFVVAYLAVLTMVILISVSPVAFALYASILYLLWDLWVHTPRLFAA